MKKPTIIALALLIALVAVFFSVQRKPNETVAAPYTIPKIDKLHRIELTRPAAGEGDEPQRVVLERREERWWLTEPLEAPVAERHAQAIEDELAKKINTDDLPHSGDDLASLELSDDKAVQVALFAENSEKPAAKFAVGKQITVEGTRARRTWLKTDEGGVYRAQAALGEVLRKDVSELRSREVHKVDRDSIEEITVIHKDGPRLKFAKQNNEWTMVEPAVDFEVERGEVNGLVSNVANLVASGFADDKKLEDVGLSPPQVEVVAKVTDGLRRIYVSNPEEGTHYAKTPKSPFVFTISQNAAKKLMPTPLSVRNLIARPLEKDAVTRVRFAGDGAVVEKTDEGWTMLRPRKGSVEESKLNPHLSTVVRLRADGYVDVDPASVGLTRGAQRVVVRASDADHTLLIGDALDSGARYAMWSGSNLVMTIPKFTYDRLAPKPSDLTGDES